MNCRVGALPHYRTHRPPTLDEVKGDLVFIHLS